MKRIAALLVLAVMGPQCGHPPVRQAVLIVLDAARPDRFSCYGYERTTTPEMDRLAAEGAVFLNGYAQATETRASLPSLLTSRYFVPPLFPNHHAVPFATPGELFRRLDDEAVSLPKALETAGFLTAAVVAHEWMTEATPMAREFMEFYNLHEFVPFEETSAYPRADQVIDFAVRWIEKNKRRNYFLYIHIMDTHFPHAFEADAREFFGDDTYDASVMFAPTGMPRNAGADFSETDLRYLHALYDGSLRYADREIGRLADFLRRRRLLKKTALVITADHGEYLLDKKGMISHVGKWFDPLAKVPLIIHYPAKVKALKTQAIAELVDVAPTILGLLDVRLPDGRAMDGRDLSAENGNGSGNAAFIGMAQAALRMDDFKCLFQESADRVIRAAGRTGKRSGVKAELYDLRVDPKEEMDLAARNPELVEKLAVLYAEKMGPLHRRYREAKTNRQPRDAFAISASHFLTDRDVSGSVLTEDPAVLQAEAAAQGWVRRSAWDNAWLFAARGAEPIAVGFALPNGTYLVSVDINGSCIMEAGGIHRVLRSKDFFPGLRWTTSRVDFGVVDVEDEMFRVVIRPEFSDDPCGAGIGPWFAVRLFGFEPVIEGEDRNSENSEKNRLREERLRSLGYIR